MRYPTFSERRRAPRLKLHLETLRKVGDRTLHESVTDVSSGGCCLVTDTPLKVGAPIEFKLVSPDHAFDVAVPAEVAHVGPSRQPGLHRFGLKFTGAGLENRLRQLFLAALRVLAQSRSPPRLETGIDAVWSGPGGTGALYVVNLGLDGALVSGTGLPISGAPLILGIHPIEAGEMVALPARVLYANTAGEATVAGLGFALEAATRTAVTRYLESLLFAPSAVPARPAPCEKDLRIGGFVVGDLVRRGRTTELYRARALDPSADSGGVAEVTMRRFTGSPRDVDLWSDRSLDAMLIGSDLAGQPGILNVLGATREKDASWLITESFEATSFETVLADQNRLQSSLSVNGVVAVVERALEALAGCQARGNTPVVHGDLRPGCILVGAEGEVKLTGFGCAPGSLSPGEMRVPPDRLPWFPPELFRAGGAHTAATDVYQVGAILYEALTGLAPFEAQNPDQLEKLAAAGPVRPSKFNPEVSPALDQLVLRALLPDPMARFHTAEAMLDALRALGLVSAESIAAEPSELLRRVLNRSAHRPSVPTRTPDELLSEARAHLDSEDHWQTRRLRLAPGAMLGRYEILESLAQGGMAEVYLARASGAGLTERPMVLKTILQEDTADIRTIKLFLNEARVATLLVHPNIVQLFDYGFDRGRPFIAMEWVDGVTLAELIAGLAQRGEKLPPALAARIVSEASAGLAYAHGVRDAEGRTLGLVHRDVSARNILVSFTGQVKLLDFGIAKFRGSTETTGAGTVRGTTMYVAPEQIRQESITSAVDIWALGVNLYRLLTGSPPFENANLPELLTAIVQKPQTPAHAVDAGVPTELSLIAERALQKVPGERYPWAGQMRADLERFLSGKPGAAADLKQLLDRIFPPTPSGQRRPSRLRPGEPGARAPAAPHDITGEVIADPLPASAPAPEGGTLDIQVTVSEEVADPPPPARAPVETTTEISLESLSLMRTLASRASRGPLGLGSKPRPDVPPAAAPAADSQLPDVFDRFGAGLSPSAAPRQGPEPSALVTEPMPAAPLVLPPAPVPEAAAVRSAETALGWLQIWCEQPLLFLVIPGEAAVARVWVARILLDGYRAARPDDSSYAAFDKWARAQLAPGETRWLGEALLEADPERDHENAIAALLTLVKEYRLMTGC